MTTEQMRVTPVATRPETENDWLAGFGWAAGLCFAIWVFAKLAKLTDKVEGQEWRVENFSRFRDDMQARVWKLEYPKTIEDVIDEKVEERAKAAVKHSE